MTPEFTFLDTFSLAPYMQKAYGNVERTERSVITNILTKYRHGVVG